MKWLELVTPNRKYLTLWLAVMLVTGLTRFTGPGSAETTEETSQQLTVRAILEKTEYRLAEPFEFEVVMSWSGKPGDFEVEPPQQFELTGLEMLQSSNANVTTTSGGRYQVTRRYSYTLLPVVEGSARIGQIKMSYRQKLAGQDGEPVLSDRLNMATTPLSITVLPPPRRFVIPWSMIGTIAGLLFFSGLFFVYMHRRKTMERPVDSVEELSPGQQFLETLKSEEHLIVDGEIREFYVRIEKTLFMLIQQLTGNDLSGKPVVSIIDALTGYLGEDDCKVLCNFFEITHLVKFAGQQPEPEEVERMVRALGRCVKTFERAAAKKVEDT